jgi:hypothetical protein
MAKGSTEVECGLVQGQVVDRGPQFQVIAVAVAFVAVVTPTAHVDRERPTPRRRGAVDGARAAELVSQASDRLEAETGQHLLHRDLGPQSGEVDPRHDVLPIAVELSTRSRTAEDRSVPIFL